MTDKTKRINRVNITAMECVVFEAGNVGETLYPIKVRGNENYDDPDDMFFGESIDINIPAKWDKNGAIHIVNNYPLPVTILGITPVFEVGGV